ncbi:hypothetical protein T4E_8015 [Trichinella pseudospiralis]|uniref:Uncharacterized protein n=1 Tax=Trichinella pseudospiralis TaxID=6337 RepID=A0A0V0XFT2_TRIPS|nr:hypothetical protein T4E_2428 [Trichinella pseudospiralis]KRX86679.1 hypothetical protein T4E_8015 [Trichinella pseudospiralis]
MGDYAKDLKISPGVVISSYITENHRWGVTRHIPTTVALLHANGVIVRHYNSHYPGLRQRYQGIQKTKK